MFLFCLFFIDSGVVALIFLTIGVGFSGFTISGIFRKSNQDKFTSFQSTGVNRLKVHILSFVAKAVLNKKKGFC